MLRYDPYSKCKGMGVPLIRFHPQALSQIMGINCMLYEIPLPVRVLFLRVVVRDFLSHHSFQGIHLPAHTRTTDLVEA
jgi:hypothetical protein